MAKESEKVTRIDVRIPSDIFDKIEAIAIETNQPTHHRSNKPVVTPIILNLINLGLEAIAAEDFNLATLTDKVSANNRIDLKQIEQRVIDAVSDKLSGNNQIDVEEIEKKLLASLENKLEAIVEDKLKEVIGDKVSDVESDSNDDFSEKIRQAIEDVEDDEDKEAESIIVSENKQKSEDTAVKEEEIKTESELMEDSKDKLSLNLSELAKRLGYQTHSGLSKKFKNLSKDEFIEWSKSKDPEGYGWYKVGDKFEVVDLES